MGAPTSGFGHFFIYKEKTGNRIGLGAIVQAFPERGIFARGVRGILVHVMLMRLQQRAATRHLRRSNEANMDITELYHFLFETPEGVGCLVGICLVLSLIVCVIMERRTRKRFADRPKGEDDWSIFDDDDEDEEKED